MMTPDLVEATRLWTLAVPSVSAFITALVRDFQQRDDILQETAVAVLKSFPRYDPSQPFIAWSIAIARNQVRHYYREQSRSRLSFDSEGIDAIASAFASESEQNHRLEQLASCLAKLEEQFRSVCQLRYERNLKPAAIGELLGMRANAVAKMLQRIRDRLRTCIEQKSSEQHA